MEGQTFLKALIILRYPSIPIIRIQTDSKPKIFCRFVCWTGTYQGQWLRGLRHGYGVRTSAPFGMASRFRPKSIRSSMTSLKSDVISGHHVVAGGAGLLDPAADRDKRLDDGRGGFVLKSRSDEPPARRRSFSERSSTIKKTLFQVFRHFSFVCWICFLLFCFVLFSCLAFVQSQLIKLVRQTTNVYFWCWWWMVKPLGLALKETTQHRRTWEERNFSLHPFNGQHGFLDVNRIGFNGRLSSHWLQCFIHRRGIW